MKQNRLSEIIGSRSRLRNGAHHSFRADINHHHHDHRSGRRPAARRPPRSTSTIDGSGTITTYTPGSDYITFRTRDEHRAGEVLLHQEHDDRRSGRQDG